MEVGTDRFNETETLKHKILKFLPPVIGIAVLFLAVVLLRGVFKHFHYREMIASIEHVPAWRLFSSLMFTVLSYFSLVVMEALLFSHLGRPLPFFKVAVASFVSTSISHNLGYSVLTGGSLRFRYYTALNVPTGEITSLIGMHAVFFWLGFIVLSAILFIVDPPRLSPDLHLPFATLLPVAIGFLILILIFYAAIIFKFKLKIRTWVVAVPNLKLSTALIVISALDWLFSGVALVVLLPPEFETSLSLFIGIYLLAQVVGAGSQVPGGLGVFEGVMLLLMGAGIHSSEILGSLMVYRLIYSWIPMVISAFILAINELLPKFAFIRRTSIWMRRFFSVLAPQLFAFMTFLGGTILLFSGATPSIESRLHWLNKFLPLPVLEISHFLGSLVGTGLIFLAFGLQRRLDGAYRMTVGLLFAGIVFSLLKGFDYEEAIILSLMLIALLPCHHFFYRRTLFTAIPFSGTWMAAILIILSCSTLLALFAYRHISYSNDMWWYFAFLEDAPRSMRAMVGVLTMAAILALRRLMHPAPPAHIVPIENEREKVKRIIAASDESMANLALLEDKSILLSDDQTAFIMFGVEGRSWVAMGDPIGDEESKVELLWKFRELVDQHNGWTVFYEIGRHNLHLYADMGLTLSKIGEEARTDLEAFTLKGKSNKWFRYVIRHLESDGYCFEIIPASVVSKYMEQLRRISDDWLSGKHTREKKFSQGYFNEKYLKNFPMALVRKGNRVVAFANIWKTRSKEELSLDLMRYSSEAPDGTMDYLFVELMLWGKEQGYQWFNLGMAPLSGVEGRSLAPLWYKFGSFIFHYGENFYNFRGLRQYKEKFDPVWEPKYLASPGGFIMARILTNISSLISRGFKGVIGK